MNKKLIDWWIGGGTSYSTEYQAVLDRATALGYTAPSSAQKTKQDTFMRAIQAQLANLDVLFIFWNDGSVGFGNINWANPTGNLAINNGATWTSNIGYTTDGSSTYVDSNHVLNTLTKYQQYDCSMGCYIKTNITGVVDLKAAFGARHLTQPYSAYIMQRAAGSFRFPVNNSTASSAATGLTKFSDNSWEIIKRSGNDQTFWEDKTLKGTSTDASEGVPDVASWIGCYNNAGFYFNGLAAEYGALFIGNASFNSDLLVDAFDAYIA